MWVSLSKHPHLSYCPMSIHPQSSLSSAPSISIDAYRVSTQISFFRVRHHLRLLAFLQISNIKTSFMKYTKICVNSFKTSQLYRFFQQYIFKRDCQFFTNFSLFSMEFRKKLPFFIKISQKSIFSNTFRFSIKEFQFFRYFCTQKHKLHSFAYFQENLKKTLPIFRRKLVRMKESP